jgi:hypothetical protein
MGNDVTATRHGMDYATGSSPTASTAPHRDGHRRRHPVELSRVPRPATPRPAVRTSATPRRGGLHRIRSDRSHGFMVSVVDVDFILELMRRLMP